MSAYRENATPDVDLTAVEIERLRLQAKAAEERNERRHQTFRKLLDFFVETPVPLIAFGIYVAGTALPRCVANVNQAETEQVRAKVEADVAKTEALSRCGARDGGAP